MGQARQCLLHRMPAEQAEDEVPPQWKAQGRSHGFTTDVGPSLSESKLVVVGNRGQRRVT